MKTILLALFASSSLFALTITPEALETQLKSASIIADIEILTKTSSTNSSQNLVTISTAEILHIQWRATHSPDLRRGSQISILTEGGESGNIGVFYSGIPRPLKGVRYHAYLKEKENGLYGIVGFEHGLKPITPLRNYSRNRTDGSNGDGSGAFLYWDPKYLPLPYYIAEETFRGRSELVAGIDASFKTWRDVEDTQLEFIGMGCSTAKYNENDGINNVIFIASNWGFDTSAIAITRNFYVAGTSERAGLILDSDILLNGVNHQFTIGAVSGKHDVQNIVTHEIGHFLGLGHEIAPADANATMYSVASTAETKKRALRTSDITGIRSIYSGTALKLEAPQSFCNISEANTGCRLGVKYKKTEMPYGFITGIFFLLSLLPIGRLITREKKSLL